MGKIVKYCQSCDESFAEKFGFCPNCGKSMQAFEMNPLGGAMSSVAEKADANKIEAAAPPPVVQEAPVVKTETVKITETAPIVSTVAALPIVSEKVETISKPAAVEKTPTVSAAPPVKETKTFAATAAASNGSGNYKSQATNDGYRTVESQPANDGGFHVTVIEEKNAKRRNLLLLGSLLLMLSTAIGATVFSIFNHPLDVASIGDESGLSLFVGEDVPMAVEEEKPKKEKDDGGGGGGGGRDEKTPTSAGKLANQVDKPLLAPDKSFISKPNFELHQTAATQGNKTFPPSDKPYGDPNSKYDLSSNGMGTGGGQGSGTGNGQGSGHGTGAGSGSGSGYGGGNGNGNGNGTGNGTYSPGEPPPPPVVPKKPPVPAVTEKVKIISKPRADFTEEARKNNFTNGTVTVKVTFLASGQVGSVVPVGGLPYGLTEKAIAAAKSIRFEPAKRDGVPISVVVPIQYTFTLY